MDSILALDIGSSSIRALLFSFEGKQIAGFGSQVAYSARTSEDGAWEIDATELSALVTRTIDDMCGQMRAKNCKPAAVALDTFWHGIMGVAADNKPVTPVFHPFDSRSVNAAKELAGRIDNVAQHARTGCVLHPSYPTAKLLWISETQPDVFRSATRWMSPGEFLLLEFFGAAAASTSMISATGLWNQNANDYDAELLAALPVKRAQLADPAAMDRPVQGLSGTYKSKWPELDGIPWFPALGDGACDSVGSGCGSEKTWALMVGTSGALRATVESDRIDIPKGLFCYRIDRHRFVTGGALSNGGEVYAWMKRNLKLPEDSEIEKQIAAMPAGINGLTVLPLFAGERSPEWRTDVRGVIAGLSSATTAIEILHAALEGVALRFRNIYDIMVGAFGAPNDVVASGAALGHSPAWTKMMADALGHPLVLCLEPEATSRGAALLALERLGILKTLDDVSPHYGVTVHPDESNHQVYNAALEQQRILYSRIFEEK